MLLGIYEGLNASGDIQGVFFLHWYPPKGKDGVSKTDEFSEKFQKGGGGHFQSKNLCCRFWTLNRAFSA